MIATLPMYDQPWLREANDRLWAWLAEELRARGIADVSDALQRGADLDALWTSPALLLAQTCGYPLVTRLRDRVRLVATPHYEAEGCDGPFHRAAILVRRDDTVCTLSGLQGRIAGVNGYDSNSGMNLFRAAIAPVTTEPTFFASVLETGSHARTFAALISGKIDVAAIDGVTWALLGDRYPDHAQRLRVLEWTTASPALPFITSLNTLDNLVAALRETLEAAANAPSLRSTLRTLRIKSFSIEPIDTYERIVEIEKQAIEGGYPQLA